jgi:hypothetical protein
VKPVTAPAPVAAAKPVAAPAPKPVAVVKPMTAPVAIPQKPKLDDASALASATLGDFFDLLIAGQTLILSKEGDAFILSLNEGKPIASKTAAPKAVESSGPKLRGDAYWHEVLTPEYDTWFYADAGTGKAWQDMTPEEKDAFVESLGITYEPHDDPRVNSLHQVTTLLKHLGIVKYKKEYKDAKVRDALRA